VPGLDAGALRCRRKFLHFFPKGFLDPTYLEWERDYKWEAHQRWRETLGRGAFEAALRAGRHAEIARHAAGIEARTNLLFSFEKMALRDAVRSAAGARLFAEGLFQYLHGRGRLSARLVAWCEVLGAMPRRQTRVLTWPLATVFGFIAQPERHMFMKPRVTMEAARRYGFALTYTSRPDWPTYESLLAFAERVRRDQADLGPRDMIDLQGFIWVQGSSEYDA
jgi:hypothetical protein